MRMRAIALMLSLALIAPARAQLAPDDAKTAAEIAASVKPLPKLPAVKSDLVLPPALAATMGMISTMAYDAKTGVLYLLQRGAKADPIVAVDKSGKVLRSWG